MRHQPMAIAFVIALFGTAAIAIRPGSGASDWAAILVGAALAAAMTGIAAAIVQFLPERLFLAAAVVGAMSVSLCVSGLLYAAESIWLAPLASSTVFVWAGATIVALLVSRRLGVRLPPVQS